MKSKNYIRFLLAAALLLSTVGCSSSPTSDQTTNDNPSSDPSAVTEAPVVDPLDQLGEYDFGGASYTMYLRKDPNYNPDDFVVEQGTGDIVNDAVYARNLKISERFHINFSYNYDDTNTSTYNTPGIVAIQAGDHANDIFAMHGAHLFYNATRGMFLDWNVYMENNDLSQTWWDQDFRTKTAIGGKLFGMTGAISYNSIGGTFCIFFNKEIATRYELEFPYQSVLDGTWTFEKFQTMSRAVTADLNGDGTISADADQYGLYSSSWGFPIATFYMAGDSIITLDEEGTPTLTAHNERTEDIMQKLKNYYSEPGALIPGYTDQTDIDLFRMERALFGSASMGALIRYRDMEAEIGVVPYPKYDENTDRYYSLVDAGENVFSIPTTAVNNDMTKISIITEALAIEGYYSVLPIYYEKALKTKYARDNESEQMLEMITASRYFDYGYFDATIDWNLSYIGRTMLNQTKDFASYYASIRKSAEKNLDKVFQMYLDVE